MEWIVLSTGRTTSIVMSIQRYWILVARKLNGEATPEELSELAGLSVQQEEEQRTAAALEQIWQQQTPGMPAAEEQRLLSLLEQRVPELVAPVVTTPARHRWKYLLAAAMVLTIFSTGGYYFFSHLPEKNNIHEVLANRGTRSQVTLPDGTLVWLNAGSKLTYSDDYGIRERYLQLEGEAYFDVAAQADIPFKVQVKDATIQVLGTTFNLRAYPEEPEIETALISGSVQLQYRQADAVHRALLKPGQKIILTRREGTNTFTARWDSLWRDQRQAVTETAWKDNTLSFDKEKFSSLAARLERWYNITVVFEHSRLKALEFSGSIKGEQMNEVMTVLSRSSGQFSWHYNQASRVLTISTQTKIR